MEEAVGKIWHKLVSRWAYKGYPEAKVELKEMSATLSVFFRAMGGSGALRIAEVNEIEHGARRKFLQRIAGSNTHIALAWRDNETLRLPKVLDSLPDVELNRNHYFWLAALASVDDAYLTVDNYANDSSWIIVAQRRTLAVLDKYPGLAKKYKKLIDAHIQKRPDPSTLPQDEAEVENQLRQALLEPGSIQQLDHCSVPPAPVDLWLNPFPPIATQSKAANDDEDAQPNDKKGKVKRGSKRKHKVEETEIPQDQNAALLVMRHETDLFTLSEMLKVNRATEEDDDLGNANEMADDLEYLSIAKDKKASASRVRFDLDLPSAESDDIELSDGKLFPEWNYKKNQYRENFCRVIPTLSQGAVPCKLPEHLQVPARRLRRQFESLKSNRQWVRAQEEGNELDLESFINYCGERSNGHKVAEPKLYQQLLTRHRDLASLVLADLSLSTEAGIDNDQQVIDVIKDSLYLFSECLSVTADKFALYGFTSRRREKVRFTTIKGFEDKYDDTVKGHLQALKPGFYTRMGAAIRQAIEILAKQPNKQKVLLLVTDGKPNDLDQYEGRYGLEDTRMAIMEAKQQGLIPFCITIDQDAEAYLPYVFGSNGFTCIKNAAQLPSALPELYAQLTQL